MLRKIRSPPSETAPYETELPRVLLDATSCLVAPETAAETSDIGVHSAVGKPSDIVVEILHCAPSPKRFDPRRARVLQLGC